MRVLNESSERGLRPRETVKQEQQFTLILQTLQQLKSVYGDDVDKIVQGNVSNIMFLKSTDDQMIETLSKMSGNTHHTATDQKMVTFDSERFWLRTEGKISYTMSTTERPVISYNDMAFISQRNSIVFRAGDAPIWNRNETILPMSWRLLRQKCITQPGKEYTLQTIPTLSSAAEFDVRKNQPDFQKMLDKRVAQAMKADAAKSVFMEGYGYNDYDMEQLDVDTAADEMMNLINMFLNAGNDTMAPEDAIYYDDVAAQLDYAPVERNDEVLVAAQAAQRQYQERERKRWAGGTLGISDLLGSSVDADVPNHQLDSEIISAFLEVKGSFEQDFDNFSVRSGEVYSVPDSKPFIVKRSGDSAMLSELNDAAKDPESGVFAEGEVSANELSQFGSWEVTDYFIRFLATRDKWDFAQGRFEEEMARRLRDH